MAHACNSEAQAEHAHRRHSLTKVVPLHAPAVGASVARGVADPPTATPHQVGRHLETSVATGERDTAHADVGEPGGKDSREEGDFVRQGITGR